MLCSQVTSHYYVLVNFKSFKSYFPSFLFFVVVVVVVVTSLLLYRPVSTYFCEFWLFYIVEQQPTPESVTEEQSEHLEPSVADTTGIYFF